jgi:hypothetical protein
MKKIFFLLLSVSILFSACKKDNSRIFSESFDERINSSLAKYQAVLTSAQYGWKALITTDHGNGGTYAFYMKFNDSNRVTMLSDFDTSFAVTPKTSGYRLRQQQQPTLIFDTYSYVHVLADPNENAVIFSNVNGGPVGQGLLSDFEFIVNPDDLGTDTLKFTGKVNGAKLVMTKATAQEAGIFLGGQWVLLESYLTKRLLTYYKRTSIGGEAYDIYNNPFEKSITFQKVNGTTVTKHKTGYYNTIDGVVLYDPLPVGNGAVSNIDIGSWDASTSTLNVKIGTENTSITETVFPLEGALQTTAPQEWWNFAVVNGDTYWITIDGFHVDGVDDAFNLRSLVSGSNTYYYFIYWPNYDPGNNDLFAPAFLNAAQTSLTLIYAAAPAPPAFNPNGILTFQSLGNYGNYPADPNNAARKTRNLFFQPEGFYFVKISDTKYDMVSAANGRAWLRWDF